MRLSPAHSGTPHSPFKSCTWVIFSIVHIEEKWNPCCILIHLFLTLHMKPVVCLSHLRYITESAMQQNGLGVMVMCQPFHNMVNYWSRPLFLTLPMKWSQQGPPLHPAYSLARLLPSPWICSRRKCSQMMYKGHYKWVCFPRQESRKMCGGRGEQRDRVVKELDM